MARVHVDSRKWPDLRHWQFSVERLGEDEHGVWLHAPVGTRAQRGDDPPLQTTAGFVALAPVEAWWWAEFYWDHPRWTVYVNIGTPCAWDADRLIQVDLDLDVVRRHDGAVEVLDEDEFVVHQVRYRYPQHLIDGARAATEDVVISLEQRREPFAKAADSWLSRIGSPFSGR